MQRGPWLMALAIVGLGWGCHEGPPQDRSPADPWVTAPGAGGAGPGVAPAIHQTPDGFFAHAPASGVRISWTHGGVTYAEGPSDRVSFALRAWGRDGAELAAPVAPEDTRLAVGPRGHRERVEHSWGDLVEWWSPVAGGFEQGFDLTVAPPGRGPLSLVLAVDSLTREVHEASATLGTFRYSGLVAWDADGRELPSSMEARPGGLALVIDDRDARWPITVDPLLTPAAWFTESGVLGARLGAALAGVGDLNGDGYSDAALGAPGWSTTGLAEGAVQVFYGSATGLPTAPSVTLTGLAPGASHGASVSSAGDVNGDGFSDLLVGAVAVDYGLPLSQRYSDGAAHIYFGGPLGVGATPDWTYSGGPFEGCGWRVSFAGNVNADGYSDLVLGCPGADYPNGRADVFYGSATGPSATPGWTWGGPVNSLNLSITAGIGSEVVGAGDVNGDGFADIAVGAGGWDVSPTGSQIFVNEAGLVAVFHGSATGLAPVGNPITGLEWFMFGAPDGEPKQSTAGFGGALASAGDVNGDGYSDLLIGASRYSGPNATAEGAAWLLQGGPSGLSTTASWSVYGEGLSLYLGTDVSGAGDLNGDGYADIVLGRPRYSGGVFAFFGSETGLPPGGLAAGTTITGSSNGAQFGASLSPAGDTDGDGFPELLIGAEMLAAPLVDEGGAFLNSGAAAGFSATPTLLASGAGTDEFGAALTWLGDVNGDGYADAAIGAPGWSGGLPGEGAVWVYFGGAEGPDAIADYQLTGGQAGAAFGARLAGGDFDGDGYADVVVSAPGWDGAVTDAGRVAWFAGTPIGFPGGPAWTVEGDESGAGFGAALATGDVNGDGHLDIAVGAPQRALGAGRVSGFFGGPAGPPFTSSDWVLDGTQPGAGFGASVALASDVHDDGYSDLVVGEPGWTAGQLQEGRVSVFMGSPEGPDLVAPWVFEAEQTDAALGTAVATGGDFDANGFSDLAVGAPGWSNGQVGEGRVLLFAGSATGLGSAPTWTVESDQAGASFGTAVSIAGDVDGDGDGDLLVGADLWDGASPDIGAAFVFGGDGSGSATALPQLWMSEGSGGPVALAAAGWGDGDGDGLSDLLLGFPGAGGGEARVHRGNGSDGVRAIGPAPRLLRPGTSTALSPGGRAPASAVSVELFSKPAAGRVRTRIEVEAKPMGTPFSGLGTVQGPWTDPEQSGVYLAVPAPLPGDGTPYAVRARLNYLPSEAPAAPSSRWFSLGLAGDSQGIAVRAPCFGDLDGDGACDSVDPDADGDGDPSATDCDDLDPSIYTNALETADDGVDQDCSGTDAVTCYIDGDADGIGGLAATDPDGDCNDDPNQSAEPGDCDDGDAANSPYLPEVCDGQDNDCDVAIDEGFDGDGDGVAACFDCDDTEPSNSPLLPELCDGADNDCSGTPDFDIAGEVDIDGDGFLSCEDCNETSPVSFPGAPELCDGLDNNCDAIVADESDADGDGSLSCEDCDDTAPFNTPGAPELCDGLDNNCSGDSTDELGDFDADGQTPCSGDCDDTDAGVFSGAAEVCDGGVNNDCNLSTDEFLDGDGDGRSLCFGDCDDANPATYAGAPELCDGQDNDCDGVLNFDEADEVDGDGDGVRGCEGDCDDADGSNTPGAAELCDGQDNDCDGDIEDEEVDGDEDGVTPCGGDCDDLDPEVYPGAEEACNGLDDDCDLDTDEGFDADGDGAATCAGDCDDGDPEVSPSASEIPDDGVDQDCSGGDLVTCYTDLDGDGAPGLGTELDPDGDCDDDPGQGSEVLDCDDFDAAAAPGGRESSAEECRDVRDNDCDGAADAQDLDCEAALSPALAPGCDAACDASGPIDPVPSLLIWLCLPPLLSRRRARRGEARRPARGPRPLRAGLLVLLGLSASTLARAADVEVLLIAPRREVAMNAGQATLQSSVPRTALAFPQASTLAAAWVLGGHLLDSCPTPTMSMAEVHQTLERAKSRVDLVELAQARALLSGLRARLGCLAEPADAEALWRLHFLEAVANWWDADAEAAAASLERALGIRPGEAFDPSYPPELREVYIEAQVRVREPGWALLLAPAAGPGEPGEVLVDGRATPPTGLSLLGGEHLIQIRGLDGVLRGGRLLVTGGSNLIVSDPHRLAEVIGWLDLGQQQRLAADLWTQLTGSSGTRAWVVDDRGDIEALGEPPPPRAVTASGKSRAGQPSVLLGAGVGAARYGTWSYIATDIRASIRVAGPLRVEVALVPHFGPGKRSDWDGEIHVPVLPLLAFGASIRIAGPVRPRFGATLQLAGDTNTTGQPTALVGAAGLAAVEIPLGRSPMSVVPSLHAGFLGHSGLLRGLVSVVVAL